MKIIILRIPPNTGKSDLKKLVKGAYSRGFRLPFGGGAPRITSTEILRITDSNGIVERYGLVNVEPDKSAKRAIAKLHRTKLKGKRVPVREYHQRRTDHTVNDATERRRSNLRIEVETYPVVVGVG